MEAYADIQEVVKEPPVMDTVLMWIEVDQEAMRNRLSEEGFESFGDLTTMKKKDIRDLAESYGRRTVANGRSIFGLRHIRYLIRLIHWVQDFARVGEEPTLAGINNMASFRKALDTADVWKVEKDQADTVSKAAELGKFKDKKKWPKWEPSYVNNLSTIPGVSGVLPLSYLVREKNMPDGLAEYGSFNKKAIACAPLTIPT